jgi:transposase-like protein
MKFKKIEEYVQSGGVFCPYCKSGNIEGGSRETDSGIHTQTVTCLECKKQWTDVYKLTTIEE